MSGATKIGSSSKNWGWLLAISLTIVGCSSSEGHLAASSSPGGCGQHQTVSVGRPSGTPNSLVLDIAIARGFFTDNCLDVKTVQVGAATETVKLLIAGELQFGLMTPDNIISARSQSANITAFAGQTTRLPSALSVSTRFGAVGASHDYASVMRALQGKKIGITAVGTTTEAFARANFTAVGLDPDSAQYVPVGNLQAMIAGLKNGTIDAAETYGFGPEQVEGLGIGFTVGDLRKSGVGSDEIQKINNVSVLWATMDRFIKSDPQVVAEFKKASDEAIAWATDPKNFDELFTLVNKLLPMPEQVPNGESVLKEALKTWVGTMSAEVSVPALTSWIEYVRSNLGIKTDVAASDIYTDVAPAN